MKDVHGTTTFTTDSLVQSQEFNLKPTKFDLDPIRDQTLSDFMAKPYAIASATWNTASGANTTLGTFAISSYLTSVTQWANKIQGFNLVRGTAVIRLVANANPFQQGKLLMSFIPCFGQLVGAKIRNSCRSQRTQQPCVEFDCRDATAVLKIPYVAPSNYYDIKTGTFGWGSVFLSVLSPLNTGSGGENDIQYTVFLSFEDFELAAPLVPQSSAPVKRAMRPNGVAKANTSKEAEGIASSGIITKGLNFAATVSSALEAVPVLSALAGPATWVFRGAAGIASWFGWSKPLSVAAPLQITRRNLHTMGNSTGVSMAANLGLYHDSGVEVMPDMVGNDIDEMSFNYLKQRKAFVGNYAWSTSLASDSSLLSVNMSPFTLFEAGSTNYSTHTANWRSFPPFAYVAQNFALWRGSIVLTIKIVKTDYHTGRLLITWTPTDVATTSPTVASSILSLREIVDIRGQSEIVLTLPYINKSNYLPSTSYSGKLDIIVLNELRAPETAASSVDLLVYACGGKDFEVAVPGRNGLGAAVPFYPQGGASPEADQTIVKEVVGDYVVPPLTTHFASMCTGEMFTSIKQLLTRYTPLVSSSNITPNASGTFSFAPFSINVLGMDFLTGNLIKPILGYDAIDNFAAGYAFYRGSVQIITTCTTTTTGVTGVSTILPAPAFGPGSSYSTATTYDHLVTNVMDPVTGNAPQLTGYQVFDTGVNNTEVKVPYYNAYHMTLIDPVAAGANTMPSATSDPKSYLVTSYLGAASATARIYRAASDEFQLAYFLGFPPVLISYV